MSRKWSWVGLLVLAAALVSVLAVVQLRRPGEAGDGAEVETDVAVHVGEISRVSLHRIVTAYGRVEPAPASESTPPAAVLIGSSAAGVLVDIDCVEGQRVSEGDTLFRLDRRVAEVELERARQALAYAEKTLSRQRELMTSDGTSRRALQEAERERDAAGSALAAAETNLALLHVTAPTSGTVVRIDATLGQAVDSNTVLGEIVDLDRLVVSAAVPSREAALIEVGQRVEAPPGGTPLGKVTFVGADVDRRTDTVPVRASLADGADYRPGQFLSVRIVVEERADCLAVPLDALVTRTGVGSWIMRVEGDRAIRTPVTAGLREGGLVEVRGEGLAEGMLIVTDDAYSLPPETAVHIVGP